MVESGGLCDRNGVPDAAVSVCNRFRRHFRERSGPVHSEAGISAGSTERYDFSIICEELGLFGGIAVILLFVLLCWRFMVIANNAPDLFGALLVVGVMGHIAIQVILNIAVVTNTIPNTGISLPFISYGGSSVMFLLIEIGLVLSVARGIRLKSV